MNHNLFRRGGGIEPLHVSMPLELKSSPSISPTHHGMPLQLMITEIRQRKPPMGFEPMTSRLLSECSAD